MPITIAEQTDRRVCPVKLHMAVRRTHHSHTPSHSPGVELCEPVYLKLRGLMAGWWLPGSGRADLWHLRPCFDLDGGCMAQNSPRIDSCAPLLASHSSQDKGVARAGAAGSGECRLTSQHTVKGKQRLSLTFHVYMPLLVPELPPRS